jgi:hypothetical protein
MAQYGFLSNEYKISTFYPGAGSDNAQWTGTTLESGYVSFGLYNSSSFNAFTRFRNVMIPQGSRIIKAFIRGTCRSNHLGTDVHIKIYFNDSDDAVAPTTGTQCNDLVLTSAELSLDHLSVWSPDSQYDTPELKDMVQEVVNRSGWASGNAMMVILKDNGSTNVDGNSIRDWYDCGIAPAKKTELHVVWV